MRYQLRIESVELDKSVVAKTISGFTTNDLYSRPFSISDDAIGITVMNIMLAKPTAAALSLKEIIMCNIGYLVPVEEKKTLG